MFVLEKYLEKDDIEQILDTFDSSLLEKLNHENLLKILNYLLEQKISFWRDILIYYLDLCLLDAKDFIDKFEKLKEKYSIEAIEEDLSVLEKMNI